MELRTLAREKKTPVARFAALHEDIPQDEVLKLDDDVFRGLPSTLELGEDAPVILMSNLAIEHGLMNGTQGIVKEIIYAEAAGPNADNALSRMPLAVIIDFPKYVGPAFWNTDTHPERRTWVPLLPATRESEEHRDLRRTQFPLVLGWAMTPWKAQGMTLDRAVVKLGRRAASPGVAFVALSRVRHPDDLMLDDDFPDMSTIMRQSTTESFYKRQRWERLMRVKFSKTLRRHMRDASIYDATKVWDEDSSELATEMLRFLHAHPHLTDDDFVHAFSTAHDFSTDDVSHIWERLHAYPHIFEIAAARNELMRYALDGTIAKDSMPEQKVTKLSFNGWDAPLADWDAYAKTGTLSKASMGLLIQVFEKLLPRDIHFHQSFAAEQEPIPLDFVSKKTRQRPRIQCFPYRSVSKLWGVYIVEETRDTTSTAFKVFALLPKDCDPRAFEYTTKKFLRTFSASQCSFVEYEQQPSADVLLFAHIAFFLSADATPIDAQTLHKFLQDSSKTASALLDAVETHQEGNAHTLFLQDTTLREDFTSAFNLLAAGLRTSSSAPVPKNIYCSLSSDPFSIRTPSRPPRTPSIATAAAKTFSPAQPPDKISNRRPLPNPYFQRNCRTSLSENASVL